MRRLLRSIAKLLHFHQYNTFDHTESGALNGYFAIYRCQCGETVRFFRSHW